MPYLPSIVLAVLGLLVLVAVVLRLLASLRKFRSVYRATASDAEDRAGLIRARAAGLRVAIEQRRHEEPDR